MGSTLFRSCNVDPLNGLFSLNRPFLYRLACHLHTAILDDTPYMQVPYRDREPLKTIPYPAAHTHKAQIRE